MIHKFLNKKTGQGINVKEELAQELHKPVIEKIKRRKVYARFQDNIWAADLAEMESLSSKNKNVKYVLCLTDVFTECAWVKPLKDKKSSKLFKLLLKQ